MGSMEHVRWFARVTNDASGLEASKRSGVTTSTLNRQLKNGHLSPESVIAIARAYDVSPVESLAVTGYLTTKEASGIEGEAMAQLLTDRQMIRDLARRINADPAAWFGTFGELEDDDTGASVSKLPERSTDPEDSVGPLPYVADSSPDEPEMGDDGYHDGP